ncbi:MAG: hypothetical protein JJU10_00290 [Idiomarina sp.]|nr:hypothetical protein [Idiomarina sp.]
MYRIVLYGLAFFASITMPDTVSLERSHYLVALYFGIAWLLVNWIDFALSEQDK